VGRRDPRTNRLDFVGDPDHHSNLLSLYPQFLLSSAADKSLYLGLFKFLIYFVCLFFVLRVYLYLSFLTSITDSQLLNSKHRRQNCHSLRTLKLLGNAVWHKISSTTSSFWSWYRYVGCKNIWLRDTLTTELQWRRPGRVTVDTSSLYSNCDTLLWRAACCRNWDKTG